MEQATNPKPGRAALIAVVGAVIAGLIFLALGPASGAIALIVQVDPAGATVRLLEPRLEKGADVVATSGHARFANLSHGARVRATVSAPGYVQEVVELTLPREGHEHLARVKLKREQGLYTVKSEPSGALVYVDGKAAGVAPTVLTDLSVGPHELTAHLEGYEKATLRFDVEPGAHKELRVTLVKLEGYDAGPAVASDEGAIPAGFGRVVVKSSHTARFFLGNYVLGYGLEATRNVKPGSHRIAARAEGRGTKWEMLDVVEGELHELSFTFDEDPKQKAFDALDPSKPLYWVVRGGTIRNEGKYGDAVDHFKRALELDASDVESHRQLSRTYPALKMWKEAIFHAERYLELDPAAPDAELTKELLATYREKQAAEQ